MKNLSKLNAVFLLLLTLFVQIIFTPIAFAQQASSPCVVTKIGSPKGSPSPPAGCSDQGSQPNNPLDTTPGKSGCLEGILDWACQITSALKPGPMWGTNYFNNQADATICNKSGYCAMTRSGSNENDLYWCTYLVIDSYNLAGIKGLSLEAGDGAVVNMMAYFHDQSDKRTGYVFLPYDPDGFSEDINKPTLLAVRPGMAWFMADNPIATQNTEHTGLVKEIDWQDKDNGIGKMITLESNSDKTSHTFIIHNWAVQDTFYKLRGFGGD